VTRAQLALLVLIAFFAGAAVVLLMLAVGIRAADAVRLHQTQGLATSVDEPRDR